MIVPRLCPPGFVCDVTGLSMADQPCPQGHFCLEGTATSATTCGRPKPSSSLYPTLSHAERSSTIRSSRKSRGHQLILGARNTACWQNATTDFALQVNPYPARFWMERHALPLSSTATFKPIRGRYCLDDSCLRLEDAENMTVSDYMFDYSTSAYALRRPVPCPAGTYCHPGTAVASGNMKNFSTPQPCFESMYCPEGSLEPKGVGQCPKGYYSPFGARIACPAGSYCPMEGHWDPLPCPPGTFNSMIAQWECSKCPPGFICPGFGRVDPAICPPGYICSRDDLAAPNARCPSGFYCPNGTLTTDPFRNDTTLRPYPCRPGTYCMGGAGFDVVNNGNYLYAQNCTEGFYCELGSASPMGSGLCPKGFTCPLGTAVPVPTPPGFFAKLLGMVEPAACLPGFYAPTIETVECYPCPPGTQCENDATAVATICPPGTFRSRLGVAIGDSSGTVGTGVICAGCPQGTWSKNWELRDAGECTRCPPGTVCPIDGMTRPCTQADFPKPFEPTNKGESQAECLKKMFHYYGMLVGVADEFFELNNLGIEVPKQRGPIFQASPVGVAGSCYFNDQPLGTVVYQRFKDYYGPLYPIQTMGNFHQGYGDSKYEGYFGRGSLYIDLPVSRLYEPARNCTAGYFAYNRSMNMDRWVIGTCEADIICNYVNKAQSQPCSEGYVCDEGTTSISQLDNKCPEGYVCDFGTTPDVNLESPQGKYKELCPRGYICLAGTGAGQKYSAKCPTGYFCPSGSSQVLFGRMANDAVNQGLSATQADPFRAPYPPGGKDKLLPAQLYRRDVNIHDENCFNNINGLLQSTFEFKYDEQGKPEHPLYEDERRDPSWNRYPAQINLAKKAGKQCGRDHKWRLTKDAIDRLECNCHDQVIRVLAIWRLWRCTKGWIQVPAWPRAADNYEWPPWAYGAGSVKLGKPKNCKFQADLDNGEGMNNIDLEEGFEDDAPGLRMRLNWLDLEADPTWGNSRWSHWGTKQSADGTVWERPGTHISWTQKDKSKPPIIRLVVRGTELRGPGNTNYCESLGWLNAYDCLRHYITTEYAQQNQDRLIGVRSAPGYDRFDPFTYDAHYAIELIELFGDRVEDLIMLGDLDPIKKLLRMPLRLDMCQCEMLQRCPNGTSSPVGSTNRFDCTRTGQEVLLRTMPIPEENPDYKHRLNATHFENRLASDLTGLATRKIVPLPLNAFETATFTMDFRPLPTNMTYGDHYQISVYFDCIPCPARYVCEASLETCSYPEPFRQENEFGILCENCCKCRPKAMPSYFGDLTGGLRGAKQSDPYDERFFMLPDSKHDIVQVAVTPLKDCFVYFAVELIHGEYYGAFEQYIGDKGTVNVFTPHRAVPSRLCSMPCKYPKSNPWERSTSWGGYILPDGGGLSEPVLCKDALPSECNRANYMAYIMDEDFKGTMNIFYNHPGNKRFENDVLIDRVADWWIGDPLYDPQSVGGNATAGEASTSIGYLSVQTPAEGGQLSGGNYGHELIYHNFQQERKAMTAQQIQDSISRYEGNMLIGSRLAVPFSGNPVYSQSASNDTINVSVEVPFQHRFHARDKAVNKQLDVTWWSKADEKGPYGKGIPGIMAMPYLPFFSNCRGYDSHVMIAKLFEDHPNCSRVSMQETEYVAQWWYNGPTEISQYPASDICAYSNSTSEKYNKLWRMTPSDGFPDDPSAEGRRQFNEVFDHNYLAGDDEQGVEGMKGVKLSCQYEEDIYVPAATPRWYQQPLAKNLFHFSKYPQNVEDFLVQEPDPEKEDDVGWGWGRGPKVQEMYEQSNREKLVAVQVGGGAREGPGQQLMVPRTVVLDISFFQREPGSFQEVNYVGKDNENSIRTLVRANIDFYDKCAITDVPKLLTRFSKLEPPVYICDSMELQYCNKQSLTCQSPIGAMDGSKTEGQFEPYTQSEEAKESGTRVRLQRGLLKEGFHCETDADCRHYEYSLEVYLYGLSWFGLLNSFELDTEVYTVIFILVGVATVFISALVWSVARMMTRLKHPPPFRLQKLLMLIAPAPMYGIFLSMIPIAMGLIWIKWWFIGNRSLDPTGKPNRISMENHNGDWHYTALMTIDVIERFRTNRIGYAITALGLYCVYFGAKLFVPNVGPEDTDDARIDEVMQANQAALGDDDDEEMLPPSEFWTPLLWKRMHLLLFTLYIMTVLMVVWELSYSDFFAAYIYQFIVGFKIAQMLIDQLLASFMKENLLIAPLMVAVEVTEFMITMGASNLVEFLISYFVELALMMLERIIIDPGLKYIAKLWVSIQSEESVHRVMEAL